MFTRTKKNFDVINFLQSQHFISFTHQIDATHPKKDANGIIPAGTFYPKNDATAIGVTINDVDVSKGEQPVGVIVEGYILEGRLPEKPTPEAKVALTGLKFYSEDNQPATADSRTKSTKTDKNA